MTDQQKLLTVGLDLKRIALLIANKATLSRIDYLVNEIRDMLTGITPPEKIQRVLNLVSWNKLATKNYSRELSDELCAFGSIISVRARKL